MRMLRPMLHRNVCMCEPDAVLLAQHTGVVEPDHQPGGPSFPSPFHPRQNQRGSPV